MITILSCALTGSILLNAALGWLLRIKKASKNPEQTYDVKRLMQDLATGPAIVKFEYLDRSEMFLRSPRHS